MKPGGPAICTGTVVHRRTKPADHNFVYPIHQLWFDPDSPAELTGAHWLWSHQRPSPARFNRADYGSIVKSQDRSASERSLGAEVRTDLESVLGFEPGGPVRIVTQIRRWGWLFNPISLFLAWDDSQTHPVGAVLEVTNTPWKQRHRYPIALTVDGNQYIARFRKELHVSPFLGQDFEYEFSLSDSAENVSYRLDVVDSNQNPILKTAVKMKRLPATRANLSKELLRSAFSTRQVSTGIHLQAAKLMVKRVPFVAHPDKHQSPEVRSND